MLLGLFFLCCLLVLIPILQIGGGCAEFGGCHDLVFILSMPPKKETEKKSAGGRGEEKGGSQITSEEKARGKRKKESFRRYNSTILREIYPDASMTKNSAVILDHFVKDMIERMGREAHHLSGLGKRNTVTKRDMEAAAKLVLPYDVEFYFKGQADAAVRRYIANRKGPSQ